MKQGSANRRADGSVKHAAYHGVSSGDERRWDQTDGDKALLRNNEQLKFVNRQRGYMVCDIRKERWETTARILDKVSVPDGKISTRAKLTLEPGANRLSV